MVTIEQRKQEAESKIRNLISRISSQDEDINDFLPIMETALKNCDSSLDINSVIREYKKRKK